MSQENENIPIYASFDTQLLMDFLIENYYENEIIKWHNLSVSETKKEEKKSATKLLNFSLRVYPLMRFFHYLIENNQLKLEITPTAYSELIFSPLVKNLTIQGLKDPEIRKDLISTEETQAIIDSYFTEKHFHTSKAYKKWLNEIWENIYNLDTPFTDPYDKQIQKAVFQRVIQNLCQNSFESLGKNVSFIHLLPDKEEKKNMLRKNIYELAERYRIDRKRVIPGSDRKELDNQLIPKEEINDCAIMATCALLHLPLITEDKNGLTSKINIYREENKRFSKENKDSQFHALAEPFTAADFIINFFKDEFQEFIQDFKIPYTIQQIDRKNIIGQTVSKINNTPTTVSFTKSKSISEQEACKTNRERYRSALNNRHNSDEVQYKSTEEFFNADNNLAEDTAKAVQRYRNSSIETIAIYSYTELNKNHRNLQELKQDFWGTKDIDENQLNRPASPTALIINARKIWYNILVIINNILKKFYKIDIEKIPQEIINFLNSVNITFETTNNKITKIKYQGLTFELPENMELDAAKLLITYNLDDLNEEMILMLGINPSTLSAKGITKTFYNYIKEYAENNSRLIVKHHNPDDFKTVQPPKDSYTDTIMHHEQQIRALIGKFEQEKSK